MGLAGSGFLMEGDGVPNHYRMDDDDDNDVIFVGEENNEVFFIDEVGPESESEEEIEFATPDSDSGEEEVNEAASPDFTPSSEDGGMDEDDAEGDGMMGAGGAVVPGADAGAGEDMRLLLENMLTLLENMRMLLVNMLLEVTGIPPEAV